MKTIVLAIIICIQTWMIMDLGSKLSKWETYASDYQRERNQCLNKLRTQ